MKEVSSCHVVVKGEKGNCPILDQIAPHQSQDPICLCVEIKNRQLIIR